MKCVRLRFVMENKKEYDAVHRVSNEQADHMVTNQVTQRNYPATVIYVPKSAWKIQEKGAKV